jgi:anti-sigma B factor antagonist
VDTLEIRARTEDGTHFVRLAGELDVASADKARDALIRIAGSTVVVDLSELTFIDAAGLSALLSARRGIIDTGNDARFVNPSPRVRRVFGLLNLTHLLKQEQSSAG